jgi:hypothetical protein
MTRLTTPTSLPTAALALLGLAACADPATGPAALAPDPQVSLELVSGPASTTVCSDATTATANGWFTITPNAAYGGPIAGSLWVGPVANSGTTSIPVGTYNFTATFTLPGDFQNASLSGAVLADNAVTITLNGGQIFDNKAGVYDGSGNAVPHFQTAEAFGAASGFQAGTNTVSLALFNSGFTTANLADNPAGLDFCFTVTYQVCPAAPAIANDYLSAKGFKANSTTSKYIISLVANAMTQGAKFNGLAPCDAGYAAAVQAFVDAHL